MGTGGGDEKQVVKGDKLRIRASTYNALMDLLRKGKRNQGTIGASSISDLIQLNNNILVRNDTEINFMESFRIVRLEEPVNDVTINPLLASRVVVFKGVVPLDEYDNIAIVQGPLLAKGPSPSSVGSIGKAVVNGITPVWLKVNDESHEWANPISGETRYLETVGSCGQASILWKGNPTWASGPAASYEDVLEGSSGGSGSGGTGTDVQLAMVHLQGKQCEAGAVEGILAGGKRYTSIHHMSTLGQWEHVNYLTNQVYLPIPGTYTVTATTTIHASLSSMGGQFGTGNVQTVLTFTGTVPLISDLPFDVIQFWEAHGALSTVSTHQMIYTGLQVTGSNVPVRLYIRRWVSGSIQDPSPIWHHTIVTNTLPNGYQNTQINWVRIGGVSIP